ncbi:MAG: chromate resistance protein [Proteobacteria bacterium]|nr:chromate resistance protein [Pseudomonadota bacterium]
MNWLVFTYSLPLGKNSSIRVSLWRRLKRIGAVSPKSSVFILPDQDDCLESFQWMAQEIQQSKGEALVMKVERFEGLSEKQVIAFFHAARKKDYDELLPDVKTLQKDIRKAKSQDQKDLDRLEKLRKRFAEITIVDFFRSPTAESIKELLDDIEAELHPGAKKALDIPALNIRNYKGRVWVTRPRPYVDRLACIWLIRRFIDAKAVIRYSDTPKQNELSFDMKEAVFGHRGNLCSFEVIMRSFGLEEDGIKALAELIHEIDLRDGRYHRPAIEGIELVLKGWRQSDISDAELESRGLLFFDGLHVALAGEKN